MAILFVLLFLAAVAGIIKPYIGGLKRTHFAIAAAVAFVLAGFATRPTTTLTTAAVDNSKPVPAASPSATPDAAAQPVAQPASKWEYSTDKDAMRGATSKFASVTSDNEVDLDFPYGTVHGTIWVRRRAEDGLSIIFGVEKGQILCHSFTRSTISVKFDDKPIQKFQCTSASDGSTETAFIQGEKRFLSELKNAKKTVIEAEFFQKGPQQFVFDTAGLKWD